MIENSTSPTYYSLVIRASSKETEIWLGDDMGHLVQKATGELDTSLLPGEYVVEFKLGGATYPVSLGESRLLTESEIRSGPTCPRPKLEFLDD